jgi:hypothetical protein
MVISASTPDVNHAIIYTANNLKVGDTILLAGFTFLTPLNNQVLTIVAAAPTSGLAAYAPNANSILIFSSTALPLIIPPNQIETGIVTRLTPGLTQPSLFFTDPAQYQPPTDGSGALIITKSVMSVQNPGRQIPDTIIGSVTRVSRATLTAAQLLAANSTPIQLIPEPMFTPSGVQGTPGPGLAYSVKLAHFRMAPGSSPFVTTGALNIYLGPSSNSIPLITVPAGLLTATVPTDALNQSITPVSVNPAGLIENQPVTVSATAALASGNGMLTIVLEYTVIQM